MMRLASLALALLLSAPAQAQITAKQEVKTYAIAGTTGAALYDSIGERGPKLGVGLTSAIAYTTFDLKWRRDYQKRGKACVLASAKPFLTVITMLPKPSAKLPPATAARWKTFIDGIVAHEAVHGRMIEELAQTIHDTTVGLTVDDDPKCQKIRKVIETPLKAAIDAHRARSKAFDRVELSPGGPVHGLVMGLVGGG